MFTHFLPCMSERLGKDEHPPWKDQMSALPDWSRCSREWHHGNSARLFLLEKSTRYLEIKECNKSKVTCGNCDQKSEDASYCFNWGKFWCKDCVNAHNILRENKEHRVLALKEFQDEDFEDVLKRPAFCSKELHEKGVFKFYCKVCEVPACHNCVTLEHSKHDVEHLEIATRAVKESIASHLDTTKKSCETLSVCIRELEEQAHITERRSQIVKEQIQQTVETMIST